MKKHFSKEARQELVTLVEQEIRTMFDAFIAEREKAADTYMGAITQALVTSKMQDMRFCTITFVADCSLSPAEAPTLFSDGNDDMLYVSMGNDVWDYFAPHSDLWLTRFIGDIDPFFRAMCATKGWKGLCYKHVGKVTTGSIDVVCSIVFP